MKTIYRAYVHASETVGSRRQSRGSRTKQILNFDVHFETETYAGVAVEWAKQYLLDYLKGRADVLPGTKIDDYSRSEKRPNAAYPLCLEVRYCRRAPGAPMPESASFRVERYVVPDYIRDPNCQPGSV